MQPLKKATYLLRFDDLCPTMNWTVWSEIEAILIQHRVKPILAVVPDNRDSTLRVGAPIKGFWERVRQWQERGWTIALHGHQHRYLTRNAGIVATRKKSEFAGLRLAEQEEKLRRAVQIFQQERIMPRVWVAPGNSFDRVTVSLLPKFGIHIICDGYFRIPFVCPRRMIWIPQQLFQFRPAPTGVWTVCYHPNNWTSEGLQTFRQDVARYQPQIASLEDILPGKDERVSLWSARLCTSPRLSRLLVRTQLKLWKWRQTDCEPRPGDGSLCTQHS
jgi:peptidoglycan/xylan/chitin deacetylase (PgdA/CDA1 family)